MEVDQAMVHDGRSMKVKTSNLNEDLGQIRYIFTDKTGMAAPFPFRPAFSLVGPRG